MIKKLVIVSGLLFGVGAVISYAGGPFKYARTWVATKIQTAEDNVPLSLKIQHARQEVENLGPEVRRCMHVIAEQQVDVERMQQRLNRNQEELAGQELAIHKLRNDLKTDNATFVYAGHAYSEGEIRSDLKLRFARYRTAEGSLKRDQQILSARKTALVTNEKRLEEMLNAKKQLEVQIEQLEARNQALVAAQESSELDFDDTQLSRTKMLIRKIEKELDVKTRVAKVDAKSMGLIPVNTKPAEIETEDITQEIDSFFNKNVAKNAQIVSAKKPAGK